LACEERVRVRVRVRVRARARARVRVYETDSSPRQSDRCVSGC
jgi:hypothetical protein